MGANFRRYSNKGKIPFVRIQSISWHLHGTTINQEFGEHTMAILKSLGIQQSEIDSLGAAGALRA